MNIFEAAMHFDTLDHKALLRDIALRHNDVFLDAVKDLPVPPKPAPCPLSVHVHLVNNEHVRAIKEFRMLTGCGLKEAKDQCDIWRSQLNNIPS